MIEQKKLVVKPLTYYICFFSFNYFVNVSIIFITDSRPHFCAVANCVGEQPRSEVTSRVYSVAAVEAESQPDALDDQPDKERREAVGGFVSINYCKNAVAQ